jgi:hypothetical protein
VREPQNGEVVEVTKGGGRDILRWEVTMVPRSDAARLAAQSHALGGGGGGSGSNANAKGGEFTEHHKLLVISKAVAEKADDAGVGIKSYLPTELTFATTAEVNNIAIGLKAAAAEKGGARTTRRKGV